MKRLEINQICFTSLVLMGSCCSTRHSSSARIRSEPVKIDENSSMKKIEEITSQEQFDRLVNNPDKVNVLIVCEFYATWCSSCAQIAPIVSKWASNDYRLNVVFAKINVDENEDLSNQYSIKGLPTFLFFKRGKELARFTGTDSNTLEKLLDQHK